MRATTIGPVTLVMPESKADRAELERQRLADEIDPGQEHRREPGRPGGLTRRFNPNHDELGRFSSGDGGGGFSNGVEHTGPYGGQEYPVETKMADDLIEHPLVDPGHILALNEYTGAGFKLVNDFLRHDTGPERYCKITIGNLDEIMAGHTVPQDVTVYRGSVDPLPSGSAVGKTFSDVGYLSTSFSKSYAETWASTAFFELHIPAGTQGIYSRGSERELTLPRGLRWRVTGDTMRLVEDTHPGGTSPEQQIMRRYITAELIS